MPIVDYELDAQMRYIETVKTDIARLKSSLKAKNSDILLAPKYSASEPTYSPKKNKKPEILTEDNVLGTITYTKQGIRLSGSPISPASEPGSFSPERHRGFFSPSSPDRKKVRDVTYSPYSPIGPRYK